MNDIVNVIKSIVILVAVIKIIILERKYDKLEGYVNCLTTDFSNFLNTEKESNNDSTK